MGGWGGDGSNAVKSFVEGGGKPTTTPDLSIISSASALGSASSKAGDIFASSVRNRSRSGISGCGLTIIFQPARILLSRRRARKRSLSSSLRKTGRRSFLANPIISAGYITAAVLGQFSPGFNLERRA